MRLLSYSPPGIVPLYQLTKTQVTKFLQARLLPLLSDKVVPFDTLQEEIFHRITHKQEVPALLSLII